ncbi:MAG: trypsin-like peptidase domain-containing protein [Pseudonocardiales bacterium]|nr:trypsin-like peptidase domain-containing protein [Pseudonocardiales bacterium]
MSEINRAGNPALESGWVNAERATVEYPQPVAGTDCGDRWEPPPWLSSSVAYRPAPLRPPRNGRPPRLLIMLLVGLVIMILLGVSHVWGAASALVWAPSTASPEWTPPAGSQPWAPSTAAAPAIPPAATSGEVNPSALAAGVDPAVVDINTELSVPNGQGAGTGIVLSPSGEVLTNNHVINGATSITATDVGNGQTYPATVVGYDRDHDIAVLQLRGATGLHIAAIGDSSGVAVGAAIAAIGNAGGRGGTPSVAPGTVSALNQTVTVTDDITGSAQQLAGLIQVAADVQPGDSGGPLVNTAGQVIGIDTAGSAGSRWQPSGGDGLAIPINDAIAISKKIQTGAASTAVHIGATGVLGVLVQDPAGRTAPGHRSWGGRGYRAVSSGAHLAGVMPGSPAEQVGLSAGDTIVSAGATTVDSSATLTTLLTGYHPGDTLRLTWLDVAGQSHTATVRLMPGPPN